MPARPESSATRHDQVHPTQVRRAFLTDNSKARPATISSVDGDLVELHELDGTATSVQVHDATRLAEVLEREDLCRARDLPLVMVNTQHRVLAVATGPATPPAKLAVLIVSRLEDGGVVELLNSDEDQPSWQVFALHPEWLSSACPTK